MEPDQIARLWPSIAPGIQEAAAPTSAPGIESLNGVLNRLLSGEMRLWFITKTFEADLNKNTLYAHVTTIPVQDWATGTTNLLIYSLYSWEPMPQSVLGDAWEKMREYAKSLGCQKVIAFTSNPRVVEMGAKVGCVVTSQFMEGAA